MLKYIIKKSLLLLISLLIFSGAVSHGYHYYYDDNRTDYDRNYNEHNKDYYNKNSKYEKNYNKVCTSGTYAGFYHPKLRDRQTYKSDIYIAGGTKYATLICKNGSMSMIRTNISCNDGYYRSGNYCRDDYSKNRNYRDDYYRYRDYSNIRKYGDDYRGCSSGTYYGNYYPRLRDRQTYKTGRSITGGTKYVTLVCKNGSITSLITNISCNSGYYRSGNYCRVTQNNYRYDYRDDYRRNNYNYY